jgi:hypothetical protein
MKDLEFYEEYLQYLNWRLDEKQINKGKYSLLKISKSEYEKFIKRLEIDETFNKKIVEMIRAENRDKKLEDIIEKNDESIIEDSSEKLDDFFSEFDL